MSAPASLAMPLGILDLKERMKQELYYKKNNLSRNNGPKVAAKKERVDTGTIVKEVLTHLTIYSLTHLTIYSLTHSGSNP